MHNIFLLGYITEFLERVSFDVDVALYTITRESERQQVYG